MSDLFAVAPTFANQRTLDEVLALRRTDRGAPWPVRPDTDLLATLPTSLQRELGLTSDSSFAVTLDSPESLDAAIRGLEASYRWLPPADEPNV